MGSLKGKSISSTFKNLLQSENEITNTTLRQVESGSGVDAAMKLSTDKAEFLKVGIGTGGASPDGLLHVMSTSAGTVTSNALADEATLESSGASGLSILSGALSTGNIFFGDANDNDAGKISYSHANDSLTFGTSGSNTMVLDKSGNLNITGNLSQSEDRYFLDEYFYKLPHKDIQSTEETQSSSINNPITSNTKHIRITTVSVNLAADDTQEFTLNNSMIHSKSHVDAFLVSTSATVADNAMINVMAHGIVDGSCKIRIGTNGGNPDAMTITIQVTVDPHIDSNDHWCVLGTNSTDKFTTYAGAQPGLKGTLLGGDNDQFILSPKSSQTGVDTDTQNISPWKNVNFHSQHQTELNVAITTDSNITNTAIWAGMKLTNVGTYATDADQAYFLYATDDDLGALTTNANLHFIYSISGTDYITDLGIAVQASTVYRLKLSFDENRKISVFVNGVQYGLVTSATAGGATQSVATTKSLATTSGAAILPFVAIQALSAASKSLFCQFIKISRTLEA